MPTIEKKIDRIYEVIADKELKLGCRVILNGIERILVRYVFCHDYDIEEFWFYEGGEYLYGVNEPGHKDMEKIIGSPVMIGDILGYLGATGFGADLLALKKLLRYWTLPRNPLEAQSESCIDFIFNLTQQGKTTS